MWNMNLIETGCLMPFFSLKNRDVVAESAEANQFDERMKSWLSNSIRKGFVVYFIKSQTSDLVVQEVRYVQFSGLLIWE